MPSPAPQRRLAAILVADMVGYSRQMERDEAGTVARLRADREALIDRRIAAHGGRIVRLAGDGALVEFPSVVEATQCAIGIQRGMSERNATRPENERIQFRMGVNIGDILVEEDNLHGEGINVAARLESLCDPGGILLSEEAVRYVDGKVDAGLEYVEERTVKNIERPVRIWRIVTTRPAPGEVRPPVLQQSARRWRYRLLFGGAFAAASIGILFWYQPWVPEVGPAALDHMAYPLPDKPSIAVLPFSNMSGNQEHEYFADGMTEDLITDLSRFGGLFVIASSSSFAYKGQSPDPRQVSRELGVRYVLEGSVRRSGEQVRINAQLVDASTGGHLWAERYDGAISNVFALQDRVARRIVAALAVQLEPASKMSATDSPTSNPAAYDAYLRGMEYYRRRAPGDALTAISFLEESVSLDPEFSRGYAALASAYWQIIKWKWHIRLKISYIDIQRRAMESLGKAMAKPTPLAYQVAAQIQLFLGSYDKAIEEAERAISLDPNDADSHAALAEALIWSARPEEGLDSLKLAMRLDPKASATRYQNLLGIAHFGLMQYQEAIAHLEHAVRSSPNDFTSRMFLVSAYGHVGRDTDAEREIAALNDARQEFGLIDLVIVGAEDASLPFPFQEQLDKFRFLDGLQKAGVPDTSPGIPASAYSTRQK